MANLGGGYSNATEGVYQILGEGIASLALPLLSIAVIFGKSVRIR